MLIGAHVSSAGGFLSALARAEELGCASMQIFNQSPRMWRPTAYTDEDFAAFRERFAESPVEAVVIHAVYLLNCASLDPEIQQKSRASLLQSLRVGDGIGAAGVIVHPGSARGEGVEEALGRVGEAAQWALGQTERCPLLWEDTAGAGETLGRTFEELATLIGLCGGGKRIGLCLDSCHLLASGYDVRTPEGLAEVLDRCDAAVGLDRLRCVHLNDSQSKLGSNTDRHAPIGKGELGRKGIGAFLGEPRLEAMPVVFEGPGAAGKGPTRKDITLLKRLRREALKRAQIRSGG